MPGSRKRKKGVGRRGGYKINEYLGSLKGPKQTPCGGPGLWAQHYNPRCRQYLIKCCLVERKTEKI